ncbi:MAG: HD domain-containing protein [Gammaproteobacteria bacterium]|nr:HD domain-containing protein [Gammaproteobacteria bacterium]
MLIEGAPIEVSRDDLAIGEPVPWRLFDREQRLLLREGSTIISERQISALLMRGAIRFETVEKKTRRIQKKKPAPLPEELKRRTNIPDALQEYHHISERLMECFYRLEDEQSVPDLLTDIDLLSQSLVSVIRQDPDKALVALQLMNEYPYTVIHPIHVAILMMIMEIHLKKGEEHQLSVVKACLTQNIAMNSLQEELFTQVLPLDAEQKQAINQHPMMSAQWLEDAGVTDQLWLDMTRQHHEKDDGSGYPMKLKSDDICVEAKLLSLADRFSAMIYDRPFRGGMDCQEVMKTFIAEFQKEKRKLPLLMVQQIGIYPPGSFVRLVNGETAFVVRRTGLSGKPVVASYISPNGVMFDPPRLRDTGASPHHVIKAICKVDPSNFDLDVVWQTLTSSRKPI